LAFAIFPALNDGYTFFFVTSSEAFSERGLVCETRVTCALINHSEGDVFAANQIQVQSVGAPWRTRFFPRLNASYIFFFDTSDCSVTLVSIFVIALFIERGPY